MKTMVNLVRIWNTDPTPKYRAQDQTQPKYQIQNTPLKLDTGTQYATPQTAEAIMLATK